MSTLKKWGQEATKVRKQLFGGDGEMGVFGTGTFKPEPFCF